MREGKGRVPHRAVQRERAFVKEAAAGELCRDGPSRVLQPRAKSPASAATYLQAVGQVLLDGGILRKAGQRLVPRGCDRLEGVRCGTDGTEE